VDGAETTAANWNFPRKSFEVNGGDKMKIKTALLAIVVLFALTSCGNDFDAEAEKEAVLSAEKETADMWANVDLQAFDRLVHKDWYAFVTLDGFQGVITYDDIADGWSPAEMQWDDYEVFVSPDLAVIKGIVTWETSGLPPEQRFITSVFKKEDEQWKWIHIHNSYKP
jgi:hypothetical protein